MITFAQPQFLFALLLLPLMLFFFLYTRYRKREALNNLGDTALIARLSASVDRRSRNLKLLLWLLALMLIVLALARPQWGQEMQIVEQKGIQIMVVLDVSQSMLAEDVLPSRLERAKMEIGDLMNNLAGDEIGLTLFSGSSFIQFPLTSDYATARSFLDYANPGLISRPGTAIGDALGTARSGFDPQRSSQKVILLITDGEDHDSSALEEAQTAADENIIIYTLGFGSANGEPIPEYDYEGNISGYKKDQNGEIVLSRLNESLLQEISSLTGGAYYNAAALADLPKTLLNELGALQKEELQQQFEIIGVERFQAFLIAAIILLMLRTILPERKKEAAENEA